MSDNMTKQEYFNELVTRARDGRLPSFVWQANPNDPYDKIQVCMYRGPDGKRCAAGILIPDEKYKPSMENKVSISQEVEPFLETPIGMHPLDIRHVQATHDVIAKNWSVEKFIEGLKNLHFFEDCVVEEEENVIATSPRKISFKDMFAAISGGEKKEQQSWRDRPSML